MLFTNLIAGASILGAAVASPIHGHKDNKRDLVYVTNRVTSTVVVYGDAPMTLAGASTTVALDADHIPTEATSPISYADVTRGDAAPTAVSYTHLDVYKRQHSTGMGSVIGVDKDCAKNDMRRLASEFLGKNSIDLKFESS